MIEIKDVFKSFKTKQEDVHAVNGVSLRIEDGEIFGIIGYSGAGKSTLVRLINQLERQSAGDVVVDGRTMQTLSKKELREERRKIGMIFQHFNLLWSRTVVQNIELPLEFAGIEKSVRQKKARELIHLVGLDGKEDAYPSELSGGQKQRVGIARALANDPKILLCDEATSALDPETTEQILDLLKDINQKLHITIVMITHQMEVVQKICHRMAVMSYGKVVEIGSVKQVFEHPVNEVTKKFVQNVESDQTIEEQAEFLKKKYPQGMLVRCSFTRGNASDPIISKAIRLVKFDISIVAADITNSQQGPFGSTYLHFMNGEDEEYNTFVTYLTDHDVKVEVL